MMKNDDIGSFELLTCGTKDEEFPGVFQAIVVAVDDGWCGGEEPRQVSEELRCHDVQYPVTLTLPNKQIAPGMAGNSPARLRASPFAVRSFLTTPESHNPPTSPFLLSDHVSCGTYPCPAPANSSLSCLRAVPWHAW